MPQTTARPDATTPGLTTHALHQRAAFVVGVDKSEDNVAEARRRFPDVRFEAADGFNLKLLRSLSPRSGGSSETQDSGRGRDGPATGAPGPVSSSAQQEGDQEERREEEGGNVPQQQQQQQQPQQRQQQQQQQQQQQRGRQKGHSQDWRRPLFTKVFVDVGGIAELHTVMALVGLYTR
jgi:hypothetical protein